MNIIVIISLYMIVADAWTMSTKAFSCETGPRSVDPLQGDANVSISSVQSLLWGCPLKGKLLSNDTRPMWTSRPDKRVLLSYQLCLGGVHSLWAVTGLHHSPVQRGCIYQGPLWRHVSFTTCPGPFRQPWCYTWASESLPGWRLSLSLSGAHSQALWIQERLSEGQRVFNLFVVPGYCFPLLFC